MASLFVIQGADQGKRFEFTFSPVALGRDDSNAIRLHDTEVSRRHAELRLDQGALSHPRSELGQRHVRQRPARRPDRAQLGRPGPARPDGAAVPRGRRARRRDLTNRVDMLTKSSPEDRSAILKSIPSDEGSRVLKSPDAAGGWLRERLMNLSVMYRATQAISNVLDIDAFRPRSSSWSSSRSGRTAARSCSRTNRASLSPRRCAGATGRARRTDDDLADDRRLRAREGRGGHHHRCPDRQTVQPRTVDRRLPDPPGDLRADPGKAYHAGRPLCRHPGRRGRERLRLATNPTSAAGSARSSLR